MDKSAILAQTRKEFLHAFTAALPALLPAAMQHQNELADSAATAAESYTRFDARAVLAKRDSEICQKMGQKMETLLNRAFQTAYNTLRPSFADVLTHTPLGLLDTAAQEEEIRLDNHVRHYRNAAEQQLRDLNIRIAVLFDQENIKERENPFRPYLFIRCVILAIASLELQEDTAKVLAEQLITDLTGPAVRIYEQLNVYLAARGIASTLQLKKIHHSPAEAASSEPPQSAPLQNPEQTGMNKTSFSPSGLQASSYTTAAKVPGIASHMGSQPADRGEQLLQFVQHASSMASALPSHDHATAGDISRLATADEPIAPPASQMPGQQAAPRRSWLGAAQAVGEVLRNLFAGSDSSQPHAAQTHQPHAEAETNANDNNADTPRHSALSGMVAELQLSATPATAQIIDNGRVRNLILEMRPHLSAAAQDSTEQMVIDTVAMLFEFILSDTEVPAEVRAQLGRLQFVVLKTALCNPEFFTQTHHPARMLVNRIGSISVGLRALDPGGERINLEIRQIIETLLADKTEGLALFSTMLDEFDAFIARELRNASPAVERAVDAMESAENHTIHYAHISGMLGHALSRYRLDGYLRDFLVNDWSHAIERAGRRDEQAAYPLRLWVPDLVWSLAPKVQPSERKLLLGMIPELLDTLRTWLPQTGLIQTEQQKLLAWLAESHRLALIATHAAAPAPSLEMIRAHFATFVAAEPGLEVSDSITPVFNPRLVNEAIHELEAELDLIDHMLEQDQANSSIATPAAVTPAVQVDEADTAMDQRLQDGIAVEINLAGHPAIARLNWVSSSATTLVLTLQDHKRPLAISVKLFKRLLATGRARFLETTPLFERAIQSLLGSADRLDADRSVAPTTPAHSEPHSLTPFPADATAGEGYS